MLTPTFFLCLEGCATIFGSEDCCINSSYAPMIPSSLFEKTSLTCSSGKVSEGHGLRWDTRLFCLTVSLFCSSGVFGVTIFGSEDCYHVQRSMNGRKSEARDATLESTDCYAPPP